MQDSEFDLEKLVTLETYSSPWEAQLARAALEAEGIHAVVADEHFYRLYNPLTSLSGVRLQVRPGDLERAEELLRNRRPILYLVTEEDAAPAVPDEPGEPEALEALVTVGRYFTPWEAHLARTYLESEGIDAIVLEERLPGVSLLTGEPAALTRLEVHPADADRAQEILAEVEDLDEATE
jgi:hypothetical protein